MANQKISELSAADLLTNTDLFAVVQGESPDLTTKKTAFSSLKDSMGYHVSEVTGTEFGSNWTLKRTVLNGNDATIEIEFTTDGFREFSIPELIPADFLGKKWFKINRYMSIIQDVSSPGSIIIPMEGTISTTASNSIITGVGTNFADIVYDSWWEILDGDMNQIGNPSGVDAYHKGVWFGIAPYGIVSDTQIDLSLAGDGFTPSVSLSNSPFYLRALDPRSSYGSYDFGYVAFNDLINSNISSDSNLVTAFKISGAEIGEFCQFDGQYYYAANSADLDPMDLGNFGGYMSHVHPKDISSVTGNSLDFTYRANVNYSGVAKGFPYATLPGTIKIILQGYLL